MGKVARLLKFVRNRASNALRTPIARPPGERDLRLPGLRVQALNVEATVGTVGDPPGTAAAPEPAEKSQTDSRGTHRCLPRDALVATFIRTLATGRADAADVSKPNQEIALPSTSRTHDLCWTFAHGVQHQIPWSRTWDENEGIDARPFGRVQSDHHNCPSGVERARSNEQPSSSGPRFENVLPVSVDTKTCPPGSVGTARSLTPVAGVALLALDQPCAPS